MLDVDTTISLIEKSKNGDDNAKEKLIVENIPLIKSIVKRFKGRLEYDDLMQLGAMGLIKAIYNFDTQYGVRFSTYAVPMITGEIKRFLRDDGQIKVSRYTKTLATKISRYIDNCLKDGKDEPTIEELAKEFDIDAQEVVFALDTTKYLVSLSQAISDDESQTVEDRIAQDSSTDDFIDRILLLDCIKKLPDREKKIIIMRFFRDKTQSEIAREMGVSQVQISRIEGRILKKLKEDISKE